MIYFICPDPEGFVSGGNIFNRQVLRGFDELHIPVCRIPVSETGTLNTTEKDVLLLDSIYFNELPSIGWNHLKGLKMILVHLLPSMLDKSLQVKSEKELLNSFDFILANSLFTMEYLSGLSLHHPQILLVQPWVEGVGTPVNSVPSKNIVISNWYPAKQIDVLLKHLASHKLPEGLILHFYGDLNVDPGFTRHCLSILDEQHQLKNHVAIGGVIQHEDLFKIYRQSSCLLDVSRFESYGMSVAEAIVSGVQVLTLGNGNLKYMVGQGRCLFCKSMDDLILQWVRIQQGDLVVQPQPVSNIITGREVFNRQLTEVVNAAGIQIY